MRKWFFGLVSLLSLVIAGAGLMAGSGSVFAADQSAPSGERVSSAHGESGRGKLGLTIAQLNADLAAQLGVSRTEGVVVTAVAGGSAAESAGFQVRDVILAIGDTEITQVAQVHDALRSATTGSTLQVRVARGNQTLTLTVTVPESSGQRSCSDRSSGTGDTSSGTSSTSFSRLNRVSPRGR